MNFRDFIAKAKEEESEVSAETQEVETEVVSDDVEVEDTEENDGWF